MKWIIIVVVAIVTVIAIVYLIGYFMPVNHQSSITIQLNAQPSQVWKIITDYKDYERWRKGVKNVTYKDSAHWTETSRDGVIHYEAEILKPGETLVSRIVSKDLPFGGSWSFVLMPVGPATQLTIIENGEVYNPIFRFMSKYIFGHEATLRQFAADLDKHINNK